MIRLNFGLGGLRLPLIWTALLLAFLGWMLVAMPAANAQNGDHAIEGGWFFTQTGGDTANPLDGYAVVDDAAALFWTAFESYGGVGAVGYPVSRRFLWDGFVTQVMQKAVFQWRPDLGGTAFINVFDDLNNHGFDEDLVDLLVPAPEQFPESGLSWPEIISTRTALLDRDSRLAAAYVAAPDPLQFYGLPTSRVHDFDGLRAIRLQRAVLQVWTKDFPWAAAGTVTVANGGDLAKQLGLFPPPPLEPHQPEVVPPVWGAPVESEYSTGNWFVDTPGSTLLVRRRPSTTASVVERLTHGTEVFPTGLTVLAGGLDWVELGLNRWVAREFLRPYSPHPVPSPTPEPPVGVDYTAGQWQADVPGSFLNIRTRPSLSAPIAGRAPDGQVLSLSGNQIESGGSLWLELTNGNWVAAEFVSMPDPEPIPVAPETAGELLDRVNGLRRQLGLNRLAISSALSRSASQHANYWMRHRGDFHNEIPGREFFSGITIYDRAKAAGYELNWIDEVAGLLDPPRTLEWALASVYHRYMFLHPSAVHLGFGSASDGNVILTIFSVGLQVDTSPPTPTPTIFPIHRSTGVNPRWDGFESPDPAPGIERPLGSPITAQFRLGDDVVWGTATLIRTSDAAAEPATVQVSEWRRSLSLVPHSPLDRGERYRFEVAWTVNGQRGSTVSTFTTAP